MKNKKKAFTLIELLAVIVILAIISLIVMATVGNVTDKAEKEAYRNSVRNIIKSGENFVAQYVIDNHKDLTYPVVFTCDGTECSDGDYKLQVSGVVPKSGRVIVESQKNIRVEYLSNGTYCASGVKESIQVAKTCTDIDITKPTITGVMSGKNIILTLTDLESGIGGYCVTTTDDLNDCTWINTTSSSVTHELEVSGTYYAFARDKKLNISDSVMLVTGDIENPSVIVTRDGTTLNISLSDNEGVTSYCIIGEENNTNCIWTNTSETEITYSLPSSGMYYVFARDEVGNVSTGVGIEAPESAFCTLDFGTTWTFSGRTSQYEWTAPCQANYKIELWGAQGGNGTGGSSATNTSYGNAGSYTGGTIRLANNTKLYFYVGTRGTGCSSNANGGWNGGGKGVPNSCSYGAGGGGGAADVRYFGDVTPTSSDLAWNSALGLNSRIMVAAGGGGARSGVSGGGILGYAYGGGFDGGATQSSGYAFGYSGNSTALYTDGGGGGYYGGPGISSGEYKGFGGNSYISGHAGCLAIEEGSTSNPRAIKSGCTSTSTSIECSIHYSGLKFTDTVMVDGKGFVWTTTRAESATSMPKHDGTNGTMTGNEGVGYARITLINY